MPPISYPIRLFARVVCAIAVVFGVAGIGAVATRAFPPAPSASSFDVDASGTLDFFDVAQQLERDDAHAFVTLFVARIEQGEAPSADTPVERHADANASSVACVSPRGPQHRDVGVLDPYVLDLVGSAHAMLRGHELWLHELEPGVWSARGPPSLM